MKTQNTTQLGVGEACVLAAIIWTITGSVAVGMWTAIIVFAASILLHR